MLKTTNYNLNKPENTDTILIEDLNKNMDTLDTKIKEIENKTDNIKVPVSSVNNKTGAIVLSSTDIKTTDGTTIEAKLNTKADTFTKSDAVNSTSSTQVATSYAVKSAYDTGMDAYIEGAEALDKATTADRKAMDALGLVNTKQDKNVIAEKLPTDLPSTYPLGFSTFYTSQEGWKSSCGIAGTIAVVETCHAMLNFGITQKITWFNSNHVIQAIFKRASYSSSSWGNWIRVLDNTTNINELKTADKTVVGAINEAFTCASNGKIAIASAITGKGISASGSDTFNVLASKISNISTGKKFVIGKGVLQAKKYENTTIPQNENLFSLNSLSFKPSYVFVKLVSNLDCGIGSTAGFSTIKSDKSLHNLDTINFDGAPETQRIDIKIQVVITTSGFIITTLYPQLSKFNLYLGTLSTIWDTNPQDVPFTYYIIE